MESSCAKGTAEAQLRPGLSPRQEMGRLMPAVAPPATEEEDERQRAEWRAISITPEEERIMGETFEARLGRESPGLTSDNPAWGMLRDAYVDMARRLLEEERQVEERAEGREANTKPEVHAPSLEEPTRSRSSEDGGREGEDEPGVCCSCWSVKRNWCRVGCSAFDAGYTEVWVAWPGTY